MPVPTIEQPVPKKNIVIKQNADFTLALCIIERDDAGDAVVIDTTGWQVELNVRKEPKQANPVLLEASTANGRIVVGIHGDPGEQVNIDIRVPASVTAAITDFGDAGYDLRVLYPDGSAEYLLEGAAFLQPAYTW